MNIVNLKINGESDDGVVYVESLQLLEKDFNKLNILDDKVYLDGVNGDRFKGGLSINAEVMGERSILNNDFHEMSFHNYIYRHLLITVGAELEEMLSNSEAHILKTQEKDEVKAHEKYVTMYPEMIDEELPMKLNEFCEFIVQQNALQADKLFKQYPEIAEAFLAYFKYNHGEIVYYRGGWANIDRTFLSSSKSKSVATNFARYGNNYSKQTKGRGVMMNLTSEMYYETVRDIDGEQEVLLYRPKIISSNNIE